MASHHKPIVLRNATAITPYRRREECSLVLENGKIAQMGHPKEISIPKDAEHFLLGGQYVMPGFIDVHIHGGVGHDFTDDSPGAFEEIGKYHAQHGTTSIIATIYPEPKDRFLENIRRLRNYLETAGPERILEGIHAEGPFLNPKMHGAIRPDYMWEATVESFQEIVDAAGPWLKVMTIAPDIPGAMDVIRYASMVSNRDNMERPHALHLSIGHSEADYELISEAIDCGLDGVTHIFNAMPSIHHRKPGVLGGTLLRDELFVEVISDAVHVHPALLQMLLKVKQADKIVLISDAIRAAGMPDGTCEFSEQQAIIRDGRVYLAESPDTLAGSTLTMDYAVQTMVEKAHATIEQAAQMASLNAARILEWKYRRGILAVGKDADLVVLDDKFNVWMTIKAGHIIYSKY